MCMKLKRFKPLLLQIGILLLLISVASFILEHQKRFITIDFSKHYFPNKSIEISSFEEGEQWRGNFSYDSERVLEGKSSVIFSSWYSTPNSIINEEIVNLTSGYSKGYISLFILDKKNLSAIESFRLTLTENPNNKKEYDFTPMLRMGWNRIPVVIPNWKKINTQTFTIISKNGEIAEVNLDRFWIENTSAYTSDVLTTKSPSISLRSIGERTYLFFASPQEESFTFNSPPSINNGSVTLSFIPEHSKNVVLSLNSTSMNIGGKSMSQCMLYKDKVLMVEKILKTTSASNNLYVFLKAEARNGDILYSLSNNGVDFETCGIVKAAGKKPIQLTLHGSYLIDSYAVEY